MQIRSNEVEENRTWKGREDRRGGPISIYTFHISFPLRRKTILPWNEHVATCDKGPPLATTKRITFPSTRLLTPSSTVFQPIFPLSRTQIRVNGCNYPYPTAYCFLLFSSPDERSWRKERRNILAPSIYIRIINEPWKYPTLDSCFSRRNLLLFVYPLVESWWREGGGRGEEEMASIRK